jgi:hypothetical protein
VSRRRHPVAAPLPALYRDEVEAVAKGSVVILAVPMTRSPRSRRPGGGRLRGRRPHRAPSLRLLDRGRSSPLATSAPPWAPSTHCKPLQTRCRSERLAGAYAGLEGDLRAVEVGNSWPRRCGWCRSSSRPPARRPYHRGAAMRGQLHGRLFAVAERLAREAGFPLRRPPACTCRSSGGGVPTSTPARGRPHRSGAPGRRGDGPGHLAVLRGRTLDLYRLSGRRGAPSGSAGGLAPELADRVAETLRERGE